MKTPLSHAPSSHARRLGSALTIATLLSACGAPAARIPRPSQVVQAAAAVPPGDVDPKVWRGFLTVRATCAAWSSLAVAERDRLRSQQRTAGLVASIAGALGVGAGITTNALARGAEDDGRARDVALTGGLVVAGIGAVAGAAGIFAGVRGGPAARAGATSRAIEAEVVRYTVRALSPSGSSRDESVRRNAVELALACARRARAWDELSELALPREVSDGSRRLRDALTQSADDTPATRARVEGAVFGAPSAP